MTWEMSKKLSDSGLPSYTQRLYERRDGSQHTF